MASCGPLVPAGDEGRLRQGHVLPAPGVDHGVHGVSAVAVQPPLPGQFPGGAAFRPDQLTGQQLCGDLGDCQPLRDGQYDGQMGAQLPEGGDLMSGQSLIVSVPGPAVANCNGHWRLGWWMTSL